MAWGGAATEPPARLEDRARIEAYVLEHLTLSHAGQPLPLQPLALDAHDEHDHLLLHAELRAALPEPAAACCLLLDYDGILHEVVSHRVEVLGPGRSPLGWLHHGQHQLEVDVRPRGRTAALLVGLFGLAALALLFRRLKEPAPS